MSHHTAKAIGYGIMYVTTPLLPLIAAFVFLWAMVVDGISSAWPALMGFATGLIAQTGMDTFHREMHYHWNARQAGGDQR